MRKIATITMLTLALAAAAFAQEKGTFTDTRDKKVYKTVKIGTQTWMAENLNYDPEPGNNKVSACYDDKPANCTTYGRLYAWTTAMTLPNNCNSISCASQINAKQKGICPSGWYIPSNAEWNILMKSVNQNCCIDNRACTNAGSPLEAARACADAGNKLKASSGWNDHYGKSGDGTDDFGFSALSGGSGHSTGTFVDVGKYGNWWSTTETNEIAAYYLSMSNDKLNAARLGSVFKDAAFYSIRCVQGEAPKEAPAPKQTEQPKQAEKPKEQPKEQPKQQSSNEFCQITFPKKTCLEMPKGACKMAGGKVVDKCK